jgi:hypothetical protein
MMAESLLNLVDCQNPTRDEARPAEMPIARLQQRKGSKMTLSDRDQQKKDYLAEHLPYELKMLRYTYQQMLQEQHYLLWNAHYESFAVHARCLVDFLTNGDPRNVNAREFVAYKVVKGNIQGPMNQLNEQVFHLAKKRPKDVVGKFDTGDAEVVRRWIEENFADFLNQLEDKQRRLFDDKKADPAEDEALLITTKPDAPGKPRRYTCTTSIAVHSTSTV